MRLSIGSMGSMTSVNLICFLIILFIVLLSLTIITYFLTFFQFPPNFSSSLQVNEDIISNFGKPLRIVLIVCRFQPLWMRGYSVLMEDSLLTCDHWTRSAGFRGQQMSPIVVPFYRSINLTNSTRSLSTYLSESIYLSSSSSSSSSSET